MVESPGVQLSINSQGCLYLGFSVCLTGYNFTDASFGSLSYHRTVEAFKFAYGQRLRLGDPAFNETVNEVRVGVVTSWLLGGVVTWQRHHMTKVGEISLNLPYYLRTGHTVHVASEHG